MPAHQTRIAVLLIAYVLGCGALLGLGVSGGVQPPALVPVAIELADMNGRLPIELAADGAAALAGPVRPHHIDIFVRPSWSDHELAHVVAHELGHAVDVARNDLADHNRWRAARSIPAEIGWWADAFAADLETPGGDFAECFAAWALDEPKAATTPFGSCAGTAELMQELVHG